jgi:hypothetical protein
MANPEEASREFSEEINREIAFCRQPLRDFASNNEDRQGFARSPRLSRRYEISSEQMPVPLLISMAIKLLLGCENLGRTEKLNWEYPFLFRGVQCSISFEKFGLRLYVEERPEGREVDEAGVLEIQKKLSAASRMMEKNLLSLLCKEAVTAGKVTIPNLYYKLRHMYEYFRNLAEAAYAGEGALAQRAEESGKGTLLAGSLTKFMAIRREGLYATLAMVNSYFSLLEHLLVLSLPSTDFDPSKESFADFIGLRLFDKYDRALRGTNAVKVQQLREKLLKIAETWRNPYSHGGFDKMHHALGFQLEGVGVLPIGLSAIGRHPEFHVFPEKDQGFDELCSIFDEIDEFLALGPLSASMKWIEAGLDVPLDSNSLSYFRRAASASPDELESYITTMSEQVDLMANMDF